MRPHNMPEAHHKVPSHPEQHMTPKFMCSQCHRAPPTGRRPLESGGKENSPAGKLNVPELRGSRDRNKHVVSVKANRLLRSLNVRKCLDLQGVPKASLSRKFRLRVLASWRPRLSGQNARRSSVLLHCTGTTLAWSSPLTATILLSGVYKPAALMTAFNSDRFSIKYNI